ncbi:MAG: roadblock/LC7 domain-containing protein [Candidatus Odinarchaeota archaeon]
MLISNIPNVEKEYVDLLLKEVQKRSPDILGFSLLLNSGIPIQSTSSIDKISDAALSSAMGAAVYNISNKAMIELFEDADLNDVIMQGKKGILLLRGIEKHSSILIVMANKVNELGFIYFLVEKITNDICSYLDKQIGK